ncbi:protein kinase family protein [Flindersiella endophytica]
MELLTGAGEGREVWRVGGTVRRAVGPQTPAVHALLRHLEAVGFEGAPRVLGFDEQGREVLTYVEGEPGWNGPYDDRTLAETARTIRRFHDVVAGFTPPPDSVWREAHQPAGTYERQIICHNDLSPPNTVYAPGRAPVFIDWDLAGPAPALWDVVAAARSFVPLYVDEDCERIGIPILPRGPRLKLFCDAYGLTERAAFVPLLCGYLRERDSPNTRRTLRQLDAWELGSYLE